MDFLSLTKKLGKNVDKNLNSKYSKFLLAVHLKLLDHTKQCSIDIFYLLQKEQFNGSRSNW